MEDRTWVLCVVVPAFFILIWQVWFAMRGPVLRKTDVSVKQPVAPEEHLNFLVENYHYDLGLAEEMWGVIREPGADAGFLAVQIYARKLYVEWYLKLSRSEQEKYDGKMRGADLTVEIEKHPEYWNHLPRIISFISTVRSYTG